jgi:hypothetical protein
VLIKHLDSQRGNYAPQGDIYGREKRKMGKGFYILVAVCLLGLAYACTAQAAETDKAMKKCQERYSYSTCFYQLQR